MDIQLINNKMEIRYYKSILQTLDKMEIKKPWINTHIKKLYDNLPQETKLSETNTEKKDLNSSSETDNHKQIFADGDLYFWKLTYKKYSLADFKRIKLQTVDSSSAQDIEKVYTKCEYVRCPPSTK